MLLYLPLFLVQRWHSHHHVGCTNTTDSHHSLYAHLDVGSLGTSLGSPVLGGVLLVSNQGSALLHLLHLLHLGVNSKVVLTIGGGLHQFSTPWLQVLGQLQTVFREVELVDVNDDVKGSRGLETLVRRVRHGHIVAGVQNGR